MRIRSGGEPNKRGGLFPCNFFETHKAYKNFGKNVHKKPFPSRQSCRRQLKREQLVAYLRHMTRAQQVSQRQYYESQKNAEQSQLLGFKDLPRPYLEYLLDELYEAIYLVKEKMSVSKLFKWLKQKWEIGKPTIKPQTLPGGSRLAGVRFFIWGIPNPFFVTVYEINTMLRQLVYG